MATKKNNRDLATIKNGMIEYYQSLLDDENVSEDTKSICRRHISEIKKKFMWQ